MSNELIELCPICIESPIQYYTECNHGYCIGCLCRIKKCAMCRNPLQRAKICIQIKQKVKLINPDTNPLIFNNCEDFDRRVTATINRNGDLQTRVYLQVNLPEFSSINNPNYISHPIDSIYYNNDGDIYDESGRRLNEPEPYNPIISYHGQIPNNPQQISSRIPRWGESNNWHMRRSYNNFPNRIPRWGYSRN